MDTIIEIFLYTETGYINLNQFKSNKIVFTVKVTPLAPLVFS